LPHHKLAITNVLAAHADDVAAPLLGSWITEPVNTFDQLWSSYHPREIALSPLI
jgi:hypothetical protein